MKCRAGSQQQRSPIAPWRGGRLLAVAAAIALALAGVIGLPGRQTRAGTDVKPYAAPVGSDYRVRPLLSTGDQVPLAGDPSKRYMMAGIPDGLGAYDNKDGTFTLLMNHELTNGSLTQTVVGGPDSRGAFVSKFVVDGLGNVVSGAKAYSQVFTENTLAGPAAAADNTTPALGRLCSGFLADQRVGFDRPIYLAGEETPPPLPPAVPAGNTGTFDSRGSSGFAFFDGEAHALPKMGHFPKENLVVMPNVGGDARTVVLIPEDGPTTPDSQLYMWVGTKDTTPGATPLARNGLLNGQLYAFVAPDATTTSETAFTAGKITGTWAVVPNAGTVSDIDLETAVDGLNAFGFVRLEDLASANQPGEAFFVTTGESTDNTNKLGRLYTIKLNATDPTQPADLRLVVNSDQVVAAGGDSILSPDNVAVGGDYLMVQEDGHSASRPVMKAKNRDGSIWRYSLSGSSWDDRVDVASAKRVAQLNPPGQDGAAVGNGVWETSGIIDASPLTGAANSWLSVVQAHAPTAAPKPKTIEDGQLFLMSANVDDAGYWLTASDGGIFNYGTAGYFGSTGDKTLNQPVVGMASTPTGKGYWLVASDGGIFNYGDAKFYGSTGSIKLNKPIVGMAATPSGKGYWLVASDGGIFSYGDAHFYGSTGSIKLNKPIVAMAATPSGLGYWLFATDGGVFNYGAAAFKGSAGGIKLNKPIVSGTAAPSGLGYWMVATDGGIFNYGDAQFYGSAGNIKLNNPIVGIASTPTGLGYWLAATDGGVFNYGDARYKGSAGAVKLVKPVVGIAGYQSGIKTTP